MPERYDAIVIGGGHNGLVAAWYLQRAGRSVLVLERREVVGGPCSPVEFFPGYWGAFTNSPGSLDPRIARDLQLERFGLEYLQPPPDPTVIQPFEDGRAFAAWRDPRQFRDGVAAFSVHDADALGDFTDFLDDLARTLAVSLYEPPPTLAQLTARLKDWRDEDAFSKLVFGTMRDLLDERFESAEIKATQAILSQMTGVGGPSTPGSPLFMIMRPLARLLPPVDGQADPHSQPMRGSTGLPRGGMGSITKAMRRSLESLGGVVRTGAAVDRILVRNERAAGVALASGEEFAADLVLSNLNPKTTFLDLLEPEHLSAGFRGRVGRLKMAGNQFKIALALDDLPRFAAARDEAEARAFAACQFRIAPSMDYMDRSFEAWREGRWPERPLIWGLTPSATDPAMAPPGKHVMSLNVYHAPYDLRDGDWSVERERFGKHTLDVLACYIPNLPRIVTDVRYWDPTDIEAELGLPEANITHGDMYPGQMFANRPLPGWSDYRTPVCGLYLCGSGTWPSGYVTGVPGRNASHQALRDLEAGMERTHAALMDERAE